MKPARNESKEAIELRRAAIAFTLHNPDDHPGDLEDKVGQKVNRDLLFAAVAYAKALISQSKS